MGLKIVFIAADYHRIVILHPTIAITKIKTPTLPQTRIKIVITPLRKIKKSDINAINVEVTPINLPSVALAED